MAGLAGQVNPIVLGDSALLSLQRRDFPVTMGFSLALLALPFLLRTKARIQAGLLLLGYVAYMIYLVLQGAI